MSKPTRPDNNIFPYSGGGPFHNPDLANAYMDALDAENRGLHKQVDYWNTQTQREEAARKKLEAENAESNERWLTRSSEVDQLKTRCSEYQRKVAGMVQRQDYEDRCDRIAELEAENAELRKEVESYADVNADLLDSLTHAVELLEPAQVCEDCGGNGITQENT